MQNNAASRNPVDIANLLMAISIVSRNLADELLQLDEAVHTKQLPPMDRHRRSQRHTNNTNSTERRSAHGPLV